MATVKQFEDLDIWKMAFAFCQWLNTVVETTNLKSDFALKNQIERSSGSAMDNIAEGFGRQGNREFINFLFIAKASSDESRSQLYRIHMKGYISDDEFEEKKKYLLTLSKKITSFISYLKDSDHRGWHFKEDQEPYE